MVTVTDSIRIKLKKIKKLSKQNGLKLQFYMGQPEEINLLGLEKGLFISIDSANSNPFNDLNNISFQKF